MQCLKVFDAHHLLQHTILGCSMGFVALSRAWRRDDRQIMSLKTCCLGILRAWSFCGVIYPSRHVQEAKRIGEQFLALEKFVNLNYLVGCFRNAD